MKLANTTKNRAVALSIAFLMSGLSLLAATNPTQLKFTVQPAGSSIGASLGSVVVQLADKSGSNVLSSGTMIKISLNKAGGFSGVTNATTDASGKATFTSLKVNLPGNNYTLLATATGLTGASSRSFNVTKGSATVTVTSSTNNLIYGQGITFTATVTSVAPATNALTGTITFKDGTVTLGSANLNAAGQAAFSAKKLSATNATHVITAIYGGSANYSNSVSGSFLQSVRFPVSPRATRFTTPQRPPP